MLVKAQVPAQKKQIELLDDVTFTTEVISSTENSICTTWSLDPMGLGSSSKMPQFSSLTLVKKEDVFTLNIEWDLNGICVCGTLDVISAEEVSNFPAVQRRYKK